MDELSQLKRKPSEIRADLDQSELKSIDTEAGLTEVKRWAGCAYGAHDWRYGVPGPGFKTCAGRCGGVYST